MSAQENIPSAFIVAVGAAALGVFGAGVYWAVTIQRQLTGSIHGDSAAPALAGRREIGLVFQTPFGDSLAGARTREAQQRLNMLRWADGEHQYAVIPVERAMQLMLEKR